MGEGRQAGLRDLDATTAPSAIGQAEVSRAALEETRAPSQGGQVARTLGSRAFASTEENLEQTTASLPRGGDEALERSTLGRYMVVKQLGAGGMGVVYKAYDPDLDRKLAIKLLRGPATADARARLLREAQAMAKLSHPNVVPVFDVGTHEDQVFIAMDFVEGTDLRRWLATPRPWQAVVAVFEQAGAGLAAAHAVGLIHRDFKPDNVLLRVEADGEVRAQVADFGLARLDDESPEPAPRRLELSGSSALEARLTHYGAIVGTPAYMSPEQHAGVAVDPRTDQFSFCVALWEALHGKRPFSGGSIEELAERARSRRRDPPPPNTRVPAWLHRVCLRGLMPDREDRFPRMEALLAALRAGRTRGRRIAAACGALVLAGTVAGGTALAMRGPEVCEGGAARVAEVWHAERRAAGERAFTATGLPYAGEAWGGAAALLDEYGASWTAMYGDACAATQVRGEQSAELLDLRMTCLNHQLAELDALIGLYEGADRSVVRRAVEAASGLPEVRRCADAEALRAGASARGASDPARVEALRSRLVAARTKARAGKAKDVLAELEAIAAESARLGEPSLTATAKLALARAQVATGADEAARASATAAVWQAIGDRDDEALWDSVTQVIAVVGYRLGRKAEATPWIEHARALLRRRGDPEPLRAALLRTIGKVELAAGDLSAAAPPLEEALAIEERTLGEVDARLVDTINALGAVRLKAGRYAEAQALFERSLRVCEATGGRGHPDLVNPLNNLALAFERQGRYDDAIAALREGQALLTAISADDPNIGLIQQNIGGMLHLAGRSAAARPELAAALAHLERTIGPEHPAIAGTLTFSGDVARALGDLGAARAAYARALAVREKALGEKHPELALCLLGLAEVDLLEGRPAEALAQIDRALAGIGEAPFDPGDLGQLHFARAKALRATGAAEASRAAAAAAGAALREAGAAGAKTLAELTRWEQ